MPESNMLPGETLDGARKLPVQLIEPNPRQSRQAFNPQALEELADSIREHGVLQPILVRSMGDHFEIVAGERRYHASLKAGLETIPAIILERDDVEAAFASAVENMQRQQLDIEDEARTFAYLMELSGLSQRKLAERLGLNHVYISRRLKLLKRPDLLDIYRSGQMNLLEVVSLVDQNAGQEDKHDDSHENHEGRYIQPASQHITEEFELVEREDLPGYVVLRGGGQADDHSQEGVSRRNSARATPFRWRPALQFRNWLSRVQPEAIPDDERASFLAQIAEIRVKLEEWERALELEAVEPLEPTFRQNPEEVTSSL